MTETNQYEDSQPRPMKVREMDMDERPREKAEKYGIRSLTNAECLAIILRSGKAGYPVTEVCKQLMKMCNNHFLELERLTDEELREFPGVGKVKVLELRTVLEIMRRYHNENRGERPQIRNSKDIYEYFRYEMANLPYEEMHALFLDNGLRVIGEMKISEGSSTGTVFDIKKVLKKALLSNAQGIVLCHNHPSGGLRPSSQDNAITQNFHKSCKTLELRMIDHIIVSTEGYYSYADEAAL